jgi:hypothetical protein
MQPSRPPSATSLRTLKLIVLAVIGSLVLAFGVLVLMGLRFSRADTIWVALPLILGAANLVLVPAVGSTVRRLPYGITPAEAGRIFFGVLRTVTFLRFSLAEAPALFGLVASVVTDSLLPYALGLAFAVPVLLLFVYPRAGIVDGIRERLESGGVSSSSPTSGPPRSQKRT